MSSAKKLAKPRVDRLRLILRLALAGTILWHAWVIVSSSSAPDSIPTADTIAEQGGPVLTLRADRNGQVELFLRGRDEWASIEQLARFPKPAGTTGFLAVDPSIGVAAVRRTIDAAGRQWPHVKRWYVGVAPARAPHIRDIPDANKTKP